MPEGGSKRRAKQGPGGADGTGLDPEHTAQGRQGRTAAAAPPAAAPKQAAAAAAHAGGSSRKRAKTTEAAAAAGGGGASSNGSGGSGGGRREGGRVLVVCGYGPGISDAVARRFGAEGFAVALLSRNQAKLDAAAAGGRALLSRRPQRGHAGRGAWSRQYV